MKIKIVQPNDELSAEDIAMLQALYSRSDASVDEHLGKVKQLGSAKFMETYYLNYSHKSIGDCGSLTIFIEGISMPAAKAIQDSPLYNGQECSTRYINYETCKVRYPNSKPDADKAKLQTELEQQTVRAMMELYKISYNATTRHFTKKLLDDNIDVEAPQVKNAIHAKACDYARGWLPVGSLTQVAWTTTIRQFNDRLPILETHPLDEVRQIAEQLRAELHALYPSSFRANGYESTLDYNLKHNMLVNYLPKQPKPQVAQSPTFVKVHHTNDVTSAPAAIRELFETRPEKTEVPSFLNNTCRIHLSARIDYGSFRDIQRHRSANVRHSYPAGDLCVSKFYMHPFEEWCDTNELAQVTVHLDALNKRLQHLNKVYPEQGVDLVELQYLYPMAQVVDMSMEMGIASAIYIAEIRSGKAVHPTARMPMIGLAQYLANNVVLPKWLHVGFDVFLTVDYDHDEIYLPRGLQTFKKDTV